MADGREFIRRMSTMEMMKKPEETKRIIRNVVLLGIAFMLQFTAYNGAINLQSSIHADESLGTLSVAALYIAFTISNIFLPALVIKWLGTKWAMFAGLIMYMPYMGAQLWPRMYTLVPTAVLLGLGGGPLWCAKCTFIAVLSQAYSKHSKSNPSIEATLSRLLGIFFTIYQVNQVWGNLISSLVLSAGHNQAALTPINVSTIPELCGANFLTTDDAVKALRSQPLENLELLVGVYLACMVVAMLLVGVGVDSMTRFQSRREKVKEPSSVELLTETVKLFGDSNQILLVIITVFIGWQQGFFIADFTAAFVSCAVGAGSVGFVMMTYGLADALGSMLTVYIVKLTGRLFIVCCGFIVQLALLIVLLVWRPEAHLMYVLYIIAGMWGLCDAVWMVNINAYYGVLFKGRERTAFSNFRLWVAIGYVIAYSTSSYLATSTKTYYLLGALLVGMLGYLSVEYRDRFQRKLVINKEDTLSVETVSKGCDNIAFQNVD